MSKRPGVKRVLLGAKRLRVASSFFNAKSQSTPLNTFTGDMLESLHDSYNNSTVPSVEFTFTAKTPTAAAESDVHASTTGFQGRNNGAGKSGKGQNEMLSDWAHGSITSFLNNLLLAEAPTPLHPLCSQCHQPCEQPISCTDCYGSFHGCQSCVSSAHRLLPTHRFKRWDGTSYNRISGAEIGCMLHLGHHGQPCNMGQEQNLVLIDVSGVHTIRIKICKHPGHRSSVRQLMECGIFPCSEFHPSTGVTFSCLRQFYLLSTECKLSAYQYWTVLVSLADPLFPRRVPDRYREFMRASRQWQHLQDLKRSGSFTRTHQNTADLVVRCPVCPRKGINFDVADVQPSNRHLFALHVSFDGSFKLYCKDKPVDSWDICLSEGRKYFVESSDFASFFQSVQSRRGRNSAKDADCNNHKAADNNWVRFGGLAETGLGAVICARHSFFMPLGTVSFTTGEQYAYADYTFVSVILQALGEGVEDVGIHYDIICHYIINMWKRWAEMSHPLRPLDAESFRSFIATIPKFHLAGHTLACYVRYSLNHIPGIGRLDAEGGERCWASLNHAAASSSDSGPGSRRDLLNQIMGRSNWVKVIGMPHAIQSKMLESRKMVAQLKADHLQFSSLLGESNVAAWATMPTEPRLEKGVWTSPFMMPETEATSLTSKIQSMLEQEADSVTSGDLPFPPGLTHWLHTGINLQMTQLRLRLDIKSFGGKPTKTQTASVNHRRTELLKNINAHQKKTHLYMTITENHSGAFSPVSTDGQPEELVVLLPSSCVAREQSIPTAQTQPIAAESELRRTLCLQHLQLVRATTMQLIHVQNTQKKHGRGIKQHNKCDAVQTRLRDRLLREQAIYNIHQSSLASLGMTVEDETAFQVLTSKDMKQLYTDVGKSRPIGEGRVAMPWYWRMALPDSADVTLSEPEFQTEYNSSLRVEWFKSREQYRRWEEETGWCQREAASFILHCQHQQTFWQQKITLSRSPGETAYCYRQRMVWKSIEDKALMVLHDILTSASGPGEHICRRVASMYDL